MTALLHINEIWAWVSVDEEGEGILSVQALIDGELTWMPLVGADQERMDSLRAQAVRIAERERRTVKLIHLSVRTDLETIEPTAQPGSQP